MILTSCLTEVSILDFIDCVGVTHCWYGTGQFAYADEDREVAEPDEYEAVDKASRTATVGINKLLGDLGGPTYFWKPVKKILRGD